MRINVLVAGVGGASLGTEIIKCLKLKSELYNIFVCDISPLAYGLFEEGVAKAFLSDEKDYWGSIERICTEAGIQVIVPGGEQPMRLLNPHLRELAAKGIVLASNGQEVVDVCSNKAKLFEVLAANNVPVPRTYSGTGNDVFASLSYPCIVKPSKDSGGSAFVSLAHDEEDARIYANQIVKSGREPIFQEYVPVSGGEYSFSVLSTPSGEVFGGVGIRKVFDIKLMYVYKSKAGIISSGYSQGLISSFPEIFKQVQDIATLLNSHGPLNIEGRVVNGRFIPFEINPRFSATTYLWATAGFNDVDYFIRLLCGLPINERPAIIEGYYLRSLSEKFVPTEVGAVLPNSVRD
ncbi:MAG: ATP-grasp domain-containing protein [Candidatus Hydrogenedentales bacterium]|jgi:carbamoyl-phosphate synthase large subunit